MSANRHCRQHHPWWQCCTKPTDKSGGELTLLCMHTLPSCNCTPLVFDMLPQRTAKIRQIHIKQADTISPQPGSRFQVDGCRCRCRCRSCGSLTPLRPQTNPQLRIMSGVSTEEKKTMRRPPQPSRTACQSLQKIAPRLLVACCLSSSTRRSKGAAVTEAARAACSQTSKSSKEGPAR